MPEFRKGVPKLSRDDVRAIRALFCKLVKKIVRFSKSFAFSTQPIKELLVDIPSEYLRTRIKASTLAGQYPFSYENKDVGYLDMGNFYLKVDRPEVAFEIS